MLRSLPGENRIVPHDTPFLGGEEQSKEGSAAISRVMAKHMGIIDDGLGIIALGALTVEQAYISLPYSMHPSPNTCRISAG